MARRPSYQQDDQLDDPYIVRPTAPISVVKAAKASLKDPTRPMTPDLFGRPLLAGESESAQARPPSAYAVPGSKQFYDSGPKLSIAQLDPYARTEAPPHASAMLGSRRSILENGPAAKSPGYTGSPSLIRSSSQAQRSPSYGQSRGQSGARGYEGDSDFSSSPMALGRSSSMRSSFSRQGPTPAEEVAALKASLAEMEMRNGSRGPSYPSSGYTLDPHRNDDLPPRPSTSRGRPSSAHGPGSGTCDGFPMAPGGRIPMPSMVDNDTGAQVLDLAAMAGYSDSDDSDSEPGSPLRPTTGSQGQGSRAGPHRTAQEPVILDPGPEFSQWQAAVDDTLQQIEAGIAALAEAGRAASQGSERPTTGMTDSRRNSIAVLRKQTGRLQQLAEQCRQHKAASKWLNSSSSAFADKQGQPLTMREAMCEHVFPLVDAPDREVRLKALGVILHVVKSRQALTQAGQALYIVSKDDTNDITFRELGLIQPMLSTIQVMLTSSQQAAAKLQRAAGAGEAAQESTRLSLLHQPLVFFTGSVKNISLQDATNQRILYKAGALQIMSQVLAEMVQQAKNSSQLGISPDSDGDGGPGPTAVAVQAIVVMRNIAVPPQQAQGFLKHGVLALLREAAESLPDNIMVVFHIGRVLSKLSLDEQCQAAMEADKGYAPMLMGLLKRHVQNKGLLLRLAFVLGNLTTHSDLYREQVAAVPGSLDALVGALDMYATEARSTQATQRPSTAQGGKTPTKASKLDAMATREDCCVKLLRLIANLAIHPKLGADLAGRAGLASSLLAILENHEYAGTSEEMVLNGCCMLTNLSFYTTPNNQLLAMEPARLLRYVTPLLLSDNEEAVVEAARAFGNFSRTAEARQYLVSARVLEALVLLLDHSSAEVLYSVCGTLINFSADAGRRGELARLDAPAKLVEVLQRCAGNESPGDMEVGTICVVCKALFNLCADDVAGSDGGAGRTSAAKSDGQQPHRLLDAAQLTSLNQVLQSLQGSKDLMSQAEVPQVTSRLSGMVQRLLSLKQ